MKPSFSVVIPCYNEEANLNRLFLKVLELFKKAPKAEIVLVNNGSQDNSLTLLNEFRLMNNTLNIIICNVKKNVGYGNGILRGLEIANSDILTWTHADLQTDLLDCLKAYEVIKDEKNSMLLLKGSRIKRKLIEKTLSYGMAMYASSQLNTWLTEINAQPKMFRRDFYDLVKINAPLDFSLDLHWVHFAKKNGLIKTIPVQFIPRIAGEAKGGSGSGLRTKINIIKRTLKYIKLLKNNK